MNIRRSTGSLMPDRPTDCFNPRGRTATRLPLAVTQSDIVLARLFNNKQIMTARSGPLLDIVTLRSACVGAHFATIVLPHWKPQCRPFLIAAVITEITEPAQRVGVTECVRSFCVHPYACSSSISLLCSHHPNTTSS